MTRSEIVLLHQVMSLLRILSTCRAREHTAHQHLEVATGAAVSVGQSGRTENGGSWIVERVPQILQRLNALVQNPRNLRQGVFW